MKKLLSLFLLISLLSFSAFANDINVRTSVQGARVSTSDSLVFATPGTYNETSDSINVSSSKEITIVYNTTSDGAVDLDLLASFSADGTNDVGSTKIADITTTGYGVANISTVYALPNLHLVVDGQGSNDNTTETTLKVGQK